MRWHSLPKAFNLTLVDILEEEANEAAGKLRTIGVQAELFIADVSDFKKSSRSFGEYVTALRNVDCVSGVFPID